MVLRVASEDIVAVDRKLSAFYTQKAKERSLKVVSIIQTTKQEVPQSRLGGIPVQNLIRTLYSYNYTIK